MSFGRWEPLDRARAPSGPGLYQARRAQGLLDYPKGKSAMIQYGADDSDLSMALNRFRASIPIEEQAQIWIRFAAADGARLPSEMSAQSLRQFEERFGAVPVLNR